MGSDGQRTKEMEKRETERHVWSHFSVFSGKLEGVGERKKGNMRELKQGGKGSLFKLNQAYC